MKTFVQLFEEMMTKYNLTMHQIAARLQIEYHTLNRFKNGKQKRSVKTLKAILSVVPCDKTMEQELYTALFKEELQKANGEDAWECMKLLKDLLSVPFLPEDKKEKTFERSIPENRKEVIVGERLISGRSLVYSTVRMLLDQTRKNTVQSSVILWGSGTDTLLSDLAFAFHDTNIFVEHLYPLLPSIKPESNKKNLTLLSEIMPCLRANFNYDVRVVYEEISSREAFFPFECLLMTDKTAVWIEKDYNHAQVITDAEVLSFYRTKFEKQYKNAQTVLQRSMNILSWQDEAKETEKQGDVCYSLNWGLCAMKLIPPTVLINHIRPEKMENLLPALHIYESRMQTVKKKKRKSEYISLAGVQYFMETGKLMELPDEWYIPFSKEERRQVLEKLVELSRDHYENEQSKQSKDNGMVRKEESGFPMVQILDEHYFKLTYGIAIQSLSERDAYMSFLGYDGKMVNFSFQEAGITKWLFQFLEFLMQSRWVYPLEEQVRLLEQMMKEIED